VPRALLFVFGVVIQGAAVGWGLFIHSRRQLLLSPEVIVLTTFDADEHVLRALRAGAAGFVLKDTPPAEIVDAVRRVARGLPVSPRR
jgi:DNA-binding NarL/FixJ family response regulator